MLPGTICAAFGTALGSFNRVLGAIRAKWLMCESPENLCQDVNGQTPRFKPEKVVQIFFSQNC